MSSSSWAGYGPSTSTQGPSTIAPVLSRGGSAERQKKPQTRQLLSCTKCRERKVKCDRTKPCSACCARGHPKECEFVVGEGNDYSPIQQSYEIRKLRNENQRLRQRLQESRLSQSGEEDEDDGSPDQKTSKSMSRTATRQRRFKTGERVDNLYFGTPGLATVVADFANLQFGSQSLTHTVPRGRDMYAAPDGSAMYPFPIIWHGGNSAIEMVRTLLTNHNEIFSCLDMFQRRAQSCYFPHTPDEVTRREVERFLDDKERNAEQYPDMLALIFATMATGMQMGVHDRCGGEWVAGAVEESRRKSDVYLAASMQALRLASFMNTPTLLSIQTLIMIGPYLTNSGRFLDAWTLFGTTIRMAHSIGLHRDPKFLDPAPPLRESMIRRTLWWWMLHMDQQYSVTLGRPLGISGVGDCPPPEPLTTNQTVLRLGDFIDRFTILARQILSSDGLMNVGKIDEFTDKLLGQWDTMPEALQFNESWLRDETPLPDWPLEVMSATLFAKVQSFLILLNRQRVERTQGMSGDHSPPSHMAPPPRPHQTMPQSNIWPPSDQPLHAAPVRGRRLVINSSVSLLHAFLFFWRRNPAVLISWTMGQQAFNASMILILDAWETENENNEWLVNHAFVVFTELERLGVHKLAKLAVKRISDGIAILVNRRQQRERDSAASQFAASSGQADQYYTSSSSTSPFLPLLPIDTASMTDFSGDAVMGNNTGMFLLEDPGLQSYTHPSFEPLGWNMAGGSSAPPSNTTTCSSYVPGNTSFDYTYNNSSYPHYSPPNPSIPSPIIPVSQVTAQPFPAVSSPFHPHGLQSSAFPLPIPPLPTSNHNTHRISTHRNRTAARTAHSHSNAAAVAALAGFTPINSGNSPPEGGRRRVRTSPQEVGRGFARRQAVGKSTGGVAGGSGGGHRLDRPPRSAQRRK
ncbi:unnamed protein product [Zymoseptoria tritici ST99CH_1A5]|uniref:Zn(2)-C6 fungal-type domain-containing protein n=1 Tax=Zymoseptoria tritici ST99CH_1A5 TaxID=1276529 RepID=A0A1Y6L5W8_ZYMTR|nr:unnamed protein product [Zymoseptoria tritici ST99CH_1A5]